MRTPARQLAPALPRRSLLCVGLAGALLGAACGGRDRAAGNAAAAGEPGTEGTSPATATAPDTAGTAAGPSAPGVNAGQPATGRTVDVQMLGDEKGYRFVPANVTIKAGDTVRWTNVSGGPHDVTFWPDSIPRGAGSRLQASMPQTMSPLTGPLLTTPNATYTISFASLPAGTYAYYCTPHLALGMKAKIVVEQ